MDRNGKERKGHNLLPTDLQVTITIAAVGGDNCTAGGHHPAGNLKSLNGQENCVVKTVMVIKLNDLDPL